MKYCHRFVLAALVMSAGMPSFARAQSWKATQVARVEGPTKGGAPFKGTPRIAVGSDGDFYVLDGSAKMLYRFAGAGSLRWQAEIATQPNPMLAMLRDTAALRETMSSMFGNDSAMAAATRMARDTSPAARKRREGLADLAGAVQVPTDSAIDRFERISREGIIGTVLMLPVGEIVVTDMLGRQTSVYDTTGAFVRNDGFLAMMEQPAAWAGLGGNIIVGTQSMMDMFAGMMGGGKSEMAYTVRVMQTPSRQGREIMRLSVPPMVTFNGTTMRMRTEPAQLLMTSDGNRLFVASNEHYSVEMYDADGQKLGTLRRNVARKPITAADRMRTTREFAQMMDSMPPMMRDRIKMEPEMGDSLPAITDLAAGDSLLFVERGSIVSRDATPVPPKMSRWDVIGWDNVYRGYIDMPAGSTIVGVRNGKLYGTQYADGKSKPAVIVWSLSPPARSR